MYSILMEKLKKLDDLKEGDKQLWGLMSPQHMVEHLIVAIKMSRGEFNLECKSPPDKLPTFKKILMGSRPLPKGFINPVTGEGLIPLKYKDLEEAKRELHSEVQKYIDYFEFHKEALVVHPIFGELNKEEWVVFHEKHFEHHFSQFGLL